MYSEVAGEKKAIVLPRLVLIIVPRVGRVKSVSTQCWGIPGSIFRRIFFERRVFAVLPRVAQVVDFERV